MPLSPATEAAVAVFILTGGRMAPNAEAAEEFEECWAMSEETYDENRSRKLEEMLRAFAERIQSLDGQGKLLAQSAELLQLIGDIRSELFHYEVRITYDTPEIAEHRRLVDEAKENEEARWERTEWNPDEDDSQR